VTGDLGACPRCGGRVLKWYSLQDQWTDGTGVDRRVTSTYLPCGHTVVANLPFDPRWPASDMPG
jgi:hypothetical protein